MVSVASTPLPSDNATQFAEWRSNLEYRLAGLEGHGLGGNPGGYIDRSIASTEPSPYGSGEIDHPTTLNGPNDNDLWLLDDRLYEVSWHGQVFISAASTWTLDCRYQRFASDGSGIESEGAIDRVYTVSGSGAEVLFADGTIHVEPSVPARYQIYFVWNRGIGTGTITMSSISTARRISTIKDIGKRP